ncbi:MAG: Elongation factor Ts [Chlamydiae bacterium]|nr:Elongation factor Ts [Chlamydiota bacterium]
MTEVTMELIKELREQTGVGITKCKEALVAADGNIDGAVSWLRKAGVASAVKKESREAKEGLVYIVDHAEYVSCVEVNSETDFVAQNEKFKEFAHNIAEQIAETAPANTEELMAQKYIKDTSMTLDEYRISQVQALGENIQISRFELFSKAKDVSIGFYMHMGGKVSSIVEIEGAHGQEVLCRDIAMHAVATDPQYLDSSEIPSDVLDSEKEIIREQIKNKPAEFQDKIIEGKLRAYYETVCLVNQKFVKDPSITVQKFVDAKAKELGKTLKVKRFLRWKIGQ